MSSIVYPKVIYDGMYAKHVIYIKSSNILNHAVLGKQCFNILGHTLANMIRKFIFLRWCIKIIFFHKMFLVSIINLSSGNFCKSSTHKGTFPSFPIECRFAEIASVTSWFWTQWNKNDLKRNIMNLVRTWKRNQCFRSW